MADLFLALSWVGLIITCVTLGYELRVEREAARREKMRAMRRKYRSKYRYIR